MQSNNTLSDSNYVAAFQTWNGGMSRLVTGQENVQNFIEASRDSFAKLHLFIDEETANASYDEEWSALSNVNTQPEEEYDEAPEDWNETSDSAWHRGVDGRLYEDFEQSIGE